MIKRLVVVICFLLGVTVVITWLLQQQSGNPYNHSIRNNSVIILLLTITWGTPFILFGWFNKKENKK